MAARELVLVRVLIWRKFFTLAPLLASRAVSRVSFSSHSGAAPSDPVERASVAAADSAVK